jgi:hypothetical protein
MSKKENNSINISNITGDVIASNNQSGGITAHTVNFEKPQRQIDETFKKELLFELQKHATNERPVVLMVSSGYDAETISLYNQLKAFLLSTRINFKDDGFTTFHPSQPVFGIKINLVDPRNVALMVGPAE